MATPKWTVKVWTGRPCDPVKAREYFVDTGTEWAGPMDEAEARKLVDAHNGDPE